MNPYEQGVAHYKAGDYQRALTSFTEAIRLDIKPIDAAYYERSKCYEALGQLDAVKADLAHMLTLPIDEARRKQITDLIALLDHAEIKPLSPPDTVPPGITVREDRDTLTLSVGDKITLTLGVDGLRVVQTPGFFSGRIAPIELPRAELGQFLCQRELGTARDDTASYILQVAKQFSVDPPGSTANLVQLLKLNNYEQIRYIQWKLRSHLNLLDIELPQEYRHAQPAQTCDYKPLRQLNKDDFKKYEGVLIICSVLAIPYFLITFSEVMNPNPDRNPLDMLVAPAIGLGSILFGVVFAIALLNPIAMRQAQEIVDKGRLTLGVVSYKNYRTWHQSKGGRQHVFDVYYRYYGYEAKFTSGDAFHQFNVGSPIKVAYLPDKPHLSKPYYIPPQPGKWLIIRIAEQIALLPTQGAAIRRLFWLCLINITVGHTLGAGLGLMGVYIEHDMPSYWLFFLVISTIIVFFSAYTAMMKATLWITYPPFSVNGLNRLEGLAILLSLSGMCTFAAIFFYLRGEGGLFDL